MEMNDEESGKDLAVKVSYLSGGIGMNSPVKGIVWSSIIHKYGYLYPYISIIE